MTTSSQHILDRLFKKRVLLHVLFWVVVCIYFTLGYGKPGKYTAEIGRSLLFLPNHIWMVYVFLYLLVPRYLLTNKLLSFFAWSLLCVIISICFSYLIHFHVLANVLGQKQTWWSVGSSLLGSLTIIGIAVSIKLLRFWYQQKEEMLMANQEKFLAELGALKSQVHPHFLFNTLNNLYSLTLEHSSLAPFVVLKLSNLLRYMLYECNAHFVSLEKELDIIDNYLELERLRYGNRLEISKSYSGDIFGCKIPPLLFLPLLENCFKHGTSQQIDQCWIHFYLHVEDGLLRLKLSNSKKNDGKTLPLAGGIGLQNVAKRLKLIYGEKCRLSTSVARESYCVSLTIEIKEATPTFDFQILNTRAYVH